jgi:capsular polysaccharide transport system ATP-binding protein
MPATSGEVRRGLRLSWPIALSGGFDGQLTGYDNVRFLTRIYERPFRETHDYVQDFSELGKHMYTPLRFYSDGMRMRLAFALSLAFDFECYLIDEVILVGDRRFQQKCHDALFTVRRHCGMIMAVHDPAVVKEFCQSALLLKGGKARLLTDVDYAGRLYVDL